eukprot:s449_g35.t1
MRLVTVVPGKFLRWSGSRGLVCFILPRCTACFVSFMLREPSRVLAYLDAGGLCADFELRPQAVRSGGMKTKLSRAAWVYVVQRAVNHETGWRRARALRMLRRIARVGEDLPPPIAVISCDVPWVETQRAQSLATDAVRDLVASWRNAGHWLPILRHAKATGSVQVGRVDEACWVESCVATLAGALEELGLQHSRCFPVSWMDVALARDFLALFFTQIFDHNLSRIGVFCPALVHAHACAALGLGGVSTGLDFAWECDARKREVMDAMAKVDGLPLHLQPAKVSSVPIRSWSKREPGVSSEVEGSWCQVAARDQQAQGSSDWPPFGCFEGH